MSMIRKDGKPRVGTEGDKIAKREAETNPAQESRRLRAVSRLTRRPVEKVTNGHGHI